jgi:excisionase family DNA binding protein
MNEYAYPTDPIPLVDAAKRVGVHRTTVLRWIKEGTIRGWKLGPCGWGKKRRIMVSLSQVFALVVEPMPASTASAEANRRRSCIRKRA